MQGVKEGVGALSRAVKKSSKPREAEPIDQGALSSIRSAGQKAFKEQAPARAATETEIQEGLAKLPPRSKKAATEFGLYHPVGGGLKLSRPVSGMYSTTVPDPMFNPPEIGIITPEQLVKEEAALFPLVGDRAAAGRYLTHIGENELEIPVRLTGGPRYMDANYNLVSPDESSAWESGLGRVTALGRQAARAGEGGRPVYGVYTAGSATNTDFNIMGANALLQQLPFSEISKKSVKEFDRAMKEGSKDFPPLPDWPGIMSPEAQTMILDKSNGIVRTKLFNVMGKENFQSMGFPDVAATRKSIIEPELLDIPTNEAGFRLARMDTTGRTIENPLIPSDYPVAMAGQVAGRLDVPADYKDIWQSHFEARRLLSQPESGDYRSFSLAHPIQYADDEWLNRLMESRYQLEQRLKEGKAEGGLVESPEDVPLSDEELAAGGLARGIKAAAKAASRAELQAKAKSLGLPANRPNKDIQRMVDIVESDPKTWTQEDYEFIRPELAIHQDLRPGSGERVESIMSEGLKRGMVDYPESMESQGYSFSKRLESPDSYLFLRGGLKFKEPTSPWLAEGNVPMFRISPKEGQSLYEAIVSSAVKRESKKAAGGAVDHKLKEWHAAQGGEVRMRDGGDPDYQGFFDTGESIQSVPVSDEILVGRGVRRRRPKIGEIFETPAYAAKSALGAIGSAVKGAAQAAAGTPGDVEMISRGVGQAISPQAGEDRLDAFLRGMEAETYLPTTEDIKAKIDPYLERFGVPAAMGQFETLGEFAGIPISVSAVKRGAEAVKDAVQSIPQTLATPPVGAIDLGGKPEKLSVNQLIAKLEAGEDLTPEQRQKAEYSKAQKEKYAQANIARQAKEPAPKEEKVKVPANELGFYSSVEKGLANTARTEGSGQDFINDIMKANPSSGELEGTGIVDWLKTKDRVTKEEVQNYLDGHKIEIEETVRGTILSREERQKLRELERAISKGWYDIPQEDLDWYEATKLKLQTFKEPKHERESLMLPGGKNYKEIVLTLPNQPVNQYDQYARTLITKYGEGFDRDLIDPSEKQKLTDLWNKSQSPEGSIDLTFRSSHFPEKNILAHMRIQDMTLGGKKTLVIEEIQSDWHQQGRKLGYGQGDEMPADDPDSLLMLYKDRMTQDQINYINDFDKRFTDATPEGQEKLYDEFEDWRKTQRLIGGGVPDAPFKKDWYQLAIRRLMKYAADNDYDQIALVGPEEQIRRGSLGTYVDGLTFEKNKDGSIKLLAEKDQSVILDKTVKPEDLELYVGKSVAKKILSTKDADGTLSGDDLMIGGEGMRQYYGRTYPDSINRIGKKYNANIEKREHIIKEFTSGDVELLHTGEYDRHGKGVIAYGVRDPETDEYIAYEYDFEKALKEANKKAPKTSMWFMDLPADLKSDVKIGQPFKEGGAVTKDDKLQNWHKSKAIRANLVKKLIAAQKKSKE